MPDDGNHKPFQDWRQIAEQATKEQDPEKLLQLVEQLCDALDAERAALRQRSTASAAPHDST